MPAHHHAHHNGAAKIPAKPLVMMSQNCEDFIIALLRPSWRDAIKFLATLEYPEMLRALTVIDRHDLLALKKNQAEGADAVNPIDFLLVEHAILTVEKAPIRQHPKPPSLPWNHPDLARYRCQLANFELAATEYYHDVILLKNTPVGFNRDLTNNLPAGLAHPPKLNDADMQQAADSLGVEVEAVKAVAQVESSVDGFQDGRRPTIRYELHQFSGRTHGAYLTSHPWLAQPTWKDGHKYHEHAQTGEYSMLYNAMILGGQCGKVAEAIQSTSWGRFQVMGFNFSMGGWTSELQFALDMFKSEGNQLKAFMGFIKQNHLQKKLNVHDWVGFATSYNGGGKAKAYGKALQDAYDQFVAASTNAKKKAPARVKPAVPAAAVPQHA